MHIKPHLAAHIFIIGGLSFAIVGCSTLFKTDKTVDASGHTNTVVSVSPTGSNSVALIGTGIALAPTPAAPFAQPIAYAIMAALTVAAGAQTYRANNGGSMLHAIIAAVEGLPTTTTASNVKQAIQIATKDAGVAPQFAALVAASTTPTTPT